MPNDYFNYSTPAGTAHTLGRIGTVDAVFQSIAAGLDKLPTEAEIKENRVNDATTGGSANVYTLTLPYPITAYVDGLTLSVEFHAANTGASTINVDGLGAKAIKQFDGSDVVSGDLPAGTGTLIRYNGTEFRLTGASPGSIVSAAASAAAAATSEANAATSESNAAASASAAATSESNAATSEANAAASEAAAAASEVSQWQVGDTKSSMRVAPTGNWLLLDGSTIGSAASSADKKSNDYQTLFEYLWDNYGDSLVPVVGGRGGSANADWTANKALTLFDGRGRTPIMAGAGPGLTARTQGATGGAEDAHLNQHLHGAGTLAADNGGAHPHDIEVESAAAGVGGFVAESDGTGSTNTATAKALSGGAHPHTISGNTANSGSDGTDKNMPPWLAMNWFIKY